MAQHVSSSPPFAETLLPPSPSFPLSVHSPSLLSLCLSPFPFPSPYPSYAVSSPLPYLPLPSLFPHPWYYLAPLIKPLPQVLAHPSSCPSLSSSLCEALAPLLFPPQ